MLYLLLSGLQPFAAGAGGGETAIHDRVTAGEWDMDDPRWGNVSQEAQGVIRLLLTQNVEGRLTAAQLLAAPWVGGSAAPTSVIVGSAAQLSSFNNDCAIWRSAASAALLLTQTPAMLIRPDQPSQQGLDSEAKEQLRDAFDVFSGRDGFIDAAEIGAVLLSFGVGETASKDCVLSMGTLDRDGDGRISFDEFCVGVMPIFAQSENSLQWVFDLFDADGSGGIDATEFASMLQKLGLAPMRNNRVDSEAILAMFKVVDTNGDGEVSFDEFVTVLRSNKARPAGALQASSNVIFRTNSKIC